MMIWNVNGGVVRWIVVLLLCTDWSSYLVEGGEEHNLMPMKEWYKRYDSYPKYCSTPEEMSTRAIPSLTSSTESKLLHVTAVIRHGARTPYRVIDCWDGFWSNPETGIWDCDLKTLMSPPSTAQIKQEENNDIFDPELATQGNMFLFEKVYDALSADGLSNKMNGTCQMGQLLLRGYVQEYTNGQLLQSTYFQTPNTRLRLWDEQDEDSDTKIYESPHFYYRADDDQRTLMSGQVLVRSLFHKLLPPNHDPTIVLHTADRELDRLDANYEACPRLKDLEYEALDSPEYQAYVNSDETKLLTKLMKDELGQDFTYDAVDCLMTTICTDRPLPSILNDYNENHHVADPAATANDEHPIYGSNRFQRLAKMTAHPFLFPMFYNNGEHSKLAMGPLWHSIMKHITPLLDNNSDTPNPKMALFSGHDNTIMPLLATLGLWDGVEWPPYASMFLIEVHETAQFASKRAFRIIYNGKVLTQNMNGCSEELCDLTVLVNVVKVFATSSPDCTSRNTTEAKTETDTKQKSDDAFSWLWTIAISALSFIVGSVGTFYYASQRLPYCKTKRSMYTEPPDSHHDDEHDQVETQMGPIHPSPLEVPTTIPVIS